MQQARIAIMCPACHWIRYFSCAMRSVHPTYAHTHTRRVFVNVCVFVCLLWKLCVFVYVHVCRGNVCVCVCMCVFVYVYVCCGNVCVYVCVCEFMYGCARTSACMHKQCVNPACLGLTSFIQALYRVCNFICIREWCSFCCSCRCNVTI
jgi:hypothetical protein